MGPEDFKKVRAAAVRLHMSAELSSIMTGVLCKPTTGKNVSKQCEKAARDLDEVAAVADGKPATRPTALGVHGLSAATAAGRSRPGKNDTRAKSPRPRLMCGWSAEGRVLEGAPQVAEVAGGDNGGRRGLHVNGRTRSGNG